MCKMNLQNKEAETLESHKKNPEAIKDEELDYIKKFKILCMAKTNKIQLKKKNLKTERQNPKQIQKTNDQKRQMTNWENIFAACITKG